MAEGHVIGEPDRTEGPAGRMVSMVLWAARACPTVKAQTPPAGQGLVGRGPVELCPEGKSLGLALLIVLSHRLIHMTSTGGTDKYSSAPNHVLPLHPSYLGPQAMGPWKATEGSWTWAEREHQGTGHD